MKKVLFGLITIVLSLSVNAQENSRNEFDFVGKMHNQILNDFVSNRENNQLSMGEVLKKVKEITLSNNDYSIKFGTQYLGLTEDQSREGINDFTSQFSNIINRLNIGNDAKNTLNELMVKTFDIENSNYESYYNYVVDLEDHILASNLTKSDKNLILYATSVARHSGHFWNGQSSATGKKFFGWVIGADIAGGIIGGVFGGVVGAIGGASGGSSLAHTINESK